MLSSSTIKLVKSLQQKKYRKKHQLFFIEGSKMLEEALRQKEYNIVHIYCIEDCFKQAPMEIGKHPYTLVSPKEMARISSFKTAGSALVLLKTSVNNNNNNIAGNVLSVYLDNIQDPGNLGTIIRTCDWFGVKNIYCGEGCADVLNPKVLQSSMGSFFRTSISYTQHSIFWPAVKKLNDFPVYGAFLDGENTFTSVLKPFGLLVMGNESQGISATTGKYISHRISIPPAMPDNQCESLNVSVATGVILSSFRNA